MAVDEEVSSTNVHVEAVGGLAFRIYKFKHRGHTALVVCPEEYIRLRVRDMSGEQDFFQFDTTLAASADALRSSAKRYREG